jgi:transposase
MTEEEVVTRLKQAAEAKRTTEEAAAKNFEDAVVEALRGGMRPAVVAKATDYSYETIRRIARKHRLTPLREPTVTSRKPKPSGDSPA